MNKIDSDAYDHYWSIVDSGVDADDKDIEKEASWRALRDQTPKRPREDYHKERAHLTDKRSAAKAYAKGNNFKNESKAMNKKLIRLTESDLHRIVKESVNRVLNESNSEDDIQNTLIKICNKACMNELSKYPNLEVENDYDKILVSDNSGYGITIKFGYTMF